jgi:competence protein ComEA
MTIFKALFLFLVLVGAASADSVPPASSPATPPQIINLNTADEATLATLVGVGPKKAKDIITYRQANGGFKTVEEFAKVHGIGPKTFETNRARLTVGDVKDLKGATPAASKDAPKTIDLKPTETKPSAPSTANGLMPKM